MVTHRAPAIEFGSRASCNGMGTAFLGFTQCDQPICISLPQLRSQPRSPSQFPRFLNVFGNSSMDCLRQGQGTRQYQNKGGRKAKYGYHRWPLASCQSGVMNRRHVPNRLGVVRKNAITNLARICHWPRAGRPTSAGRSVIRPPR